MTSTAICWIMALKTWLGIGPQKLKWASQAPMAAGWVAGTLFLCSKSKRKYAIACFKQEQASNSTTDHYTEAIFRKRGKTPSHVTMWYPHGGGIQAKASKIVILCYFLSIFYRNNCCKIIQNIKNCLLMPAPPSRGGVWCDTPDPIVRTTTHHMWLLCIINMEVPTPGEVSPEIPTHMFVISL